MYLLDVNLLIAICDADHVHHARARSWFKNRSSAGWATCPITENALLRIMGHPDYPDGPGSPAAVVPVLQHLRAHPCHVFLQDTLTLADSDIFVDFAGVTSKMLTDLYLLALAMCHGGALATLDRRIDPRLVEGGANAHVQVIH